MRARRGAFKYKRIAGSVMLAPWLVLFAPSCASAQAPGLYCHPHLSTWKLDPVCPNSAPAGSRPPVFSLNAVSEANPVNPSAEAINRVWRAYTEVLSRFGGPQIWIQTLGTCAASDVFDEFSAPHTAKLVGLQVSGGPDWPELVIDPNKPHATGLASHVCVGWHGMDTDSRKFARAFAVSCHSNLITEQYIWLHELAHLYGADHVTSYASTVNPHDDVNVYSCSNRQGRIIMKPDGSIMALVFNNALGGLRPNAWDVGGSPRTGPDTDTISPRRNEALVVVSKSSGAAAQGRLQISVFNLLGNLTETFGGQLGIGLKLEPMSPIYDPDLHGDFVPSSAAIELPTLKISAPAGPPNFGYWPTGNYMVSLPWRIEPSTVQRMLPGFTYWLSVHLDPDQAYPEVDENDNQIITRVRVRVTN